MWSGSSAPSGWSLCNGSNGTPDLRNRFIVASGGTYSEGATGGAATVTLTTAQMPSHNHTASTGDAGGHSHTTNFSSVVTQPGGNETPGGGGRGEYQNILIDPVGDHAHSVGVGNSGSDQPHENLPPYYALAFIMRIA